MLSLGLDEGRSKKKHNKDANATGSSKMRKKTANRKRKVVVDEDDNEDTTDEDDPLVRSRGNISPFAEGSEFVNITSEVSLPQFQKPSPSLQKFSKIKLRKTPATTVTMKEAIDPTPSASAINLQDLVVDTPLAFHSCSKAFHSQKESCE